MAERDPVEELVQTVREADPRLPDTNRSRGAAALALRLASEARSQPPTSARRGRAWPLWWASLGAAAAAAALLAWFGLRPAAPVIALPTLAPPASPQPADHSRAPAGTLDERAILYAASTREPGRARLEAKAGEKVQAALADHGRLVLRDGGRLDVEESTPAGIVLGLERGTLLISYDRDSGRGLAVRTKDALVRVTGTIFAIEVDVGPTRVSVARGSVQVETTGLPVAVAAGKRWEVGAKSLSAPEAGIVLALRELRAADDGRPVPGPTRAHVESRKAVVPAATEAPPAPAPGDGADAEALYRRAEQALAAGHLATAKARLLELIARYPANALVGPATYELGRIDFATRDFVSARARFADLRHSTQAGAARFREPAAFSVCRSEEVLGHQAAAMACLEHYRRDFPGSPHDGDALAALVRLHLDAGDCVHALPLIDEYLAHHPKGEQAAALEIAQRRCQD